MNNRILAMLLAIIMIVSIVPVNAFATENGHAEDCSYVAPCKCGGTEALHAFVPNVYGSSCSGDGVPCDKNCGSTGGTTDDTAGGTTTNPAEHTHVDDAGAANGGPNCVCDVAGCQEAVHQLETFAAVAATCTESGRNAFTWCRKCNKYFSDEAATIEISYDATVASAPGHKLTLVPATDSNCIEQGNVAYYECETCDKFFEASDNTKEITEKNHVYKALAEHTLGDYIQDEQNGHYKACTVDGCEYTTDLIPHNTFRYENGKKICVNCEFAFDHTCVDENADCKCDVKKCGAEMQHNIVWNDNAGKHYQSCGNANCFKKILTGWEDCTDENDDCICDVCENPLKHTLTITSGKLPTCYAEGNRPYVTCTNCGKHFAYVGSAEDKTDYTEVDITSSSVVVEKLDHTPTWVEVEGKHQKVCSVEECKAVLTEAEEHNVTFTSQYETVHQGVCTICNLVVTEDHYDAADDEDCSCDGCGKFLGHSLTSVPKVDAKCGVNGNVEHQLCEKCGKTFTMDGNVIEDVTIKARKHWEIWEYDTEADTHTKVCKYSNCRAVIVETTSHNFTYTDRAAGGDTARHNAVCSDCGFTQARAHVDEEAPFCKCDDCGADLDHDLKTVERVEAKCGIAGNKGYKVCEKCDALFNLAGGAITEEDIAIPALQHKWWPKGMDLSGTLHTEQCEYCKVIRFLSHFDNTGDCMCDYDGCTEAAHQHTVVHVPAKAATCVEEGNQEYWYFAECGQKFADEACTQPVTELIIYGTTAHTWGDWTGADDGENHERECEVCDAKETAEHDFSSEAPYCVDCNAAEGLEPVAEDPATCQKNGTKAHWISTITNRRYWDAAGTDYIYDVNELVIPQLTHDWVVDSSNGDTHVIKCDLNCGEDYEEDCVSTDGNCVCDICEVAMAGHTYEEVEYIAPTCEKPGQMAAVYCEDCNKYYDAETKAVLNTIVIPALGHEWDAEWYNDVREGTHSKDCQRCHEKISVEHELSVESVNKGNLHEWSCSICEYVETGIHFDKDGDSECDECGYDSDKVVSGSSLNNPRETITIKGDKDDTVEEKKSTWWKSFIGKLNPSYVGESQSSSAPSASVGSSSTSGTTSSGTVNPGSSSTGTSAVDAVVTFLMNLLNALLGR